MIPTPRMQTQILRDGSSTSQLTHSTPGINSPHQNEDEPHYDSSIYPYDDEVKVMPDGQTMIYPGGKKVENN